MVHSIQSRNLTYLQHFTITLLPYALVGAMKDITSRKI